ASSGGVYPLHHGDHNSHGVPPTINPVALSRGRDQPFFDPVAYGNGPDDSVTDTTEAAAITHHTILIDGRRIAYTATVGHLVTVDPSSSQPAAKIFYVAFTADGA
ncbi:peptidase S1, partial [Burkholderia cenocepacia]|nr:peptidase S1 [Burkholderia cenocepacia]